MEKEYEMSSVVSALRKDNLNRVVQEFSIYQPVRFSASYLFAEA